MKRLKILMVTLCGILVVSGCSRPETVLEVKRPEIRRGPDFCRVAVVRRWTEEEFRTRAQRWPANLKRDLAQNQALKDHCTPEEGEESEDPA